MLETIVLSEVISNTTTQLTERHSVLTKYKTGRSFPRPHRPVMAGTSPIPRQLNPSQPNPSQPNPSQLNPSQPNPSQPNPSQPNPRMPVGKTTAGTVLYQETFLIGQ
jgi:hypothetical protein